MQKQTVLICDDEALLRDILRDFLENVGFSVIEAVDGFDGLAKFREHIGKINVAILDVMMPYQDGFSLCEQIRKEDAQIPIIMLTAKNDEEDELRSFEVGADDFVPKPLRPSIIVARIQALLKRKKAEIKDVETITYKNLQIVLPKHEVHVNAQKVILSKKEYEILLYLWENQNQTLTRDQILNAIWGYDSFVTDRAVDTNITRLRNKLGIENNYIQTVRGYGYTFEVIYD